MSNGGPSNSSEPDGSFNCFCQGYLLGLNDNQANCQQGNIGVGAGKASRTSPDILAGGFFCGNPEHALDGDWFKKQLEDALAGDLLFEQTVNAQLPLTLVDPFYMHPGDGAGIPANTHDPMSADPFFIQYADAAHQDPLVPAQSRLVPTTANGFASMNSCVEDLIFERPENPDESCDLALSEAGDDNTHHDQGNWDEGEVAPVQMCQHAYLSTQPQPPTPSPEEHPIPCGRQECHICQVFSLPF